MNQHFLIIYVHFLNQSSQLSEKLLLINKADLDDFIYEILLYEAKKNNIN